MREIDEKRGQIKCTCDVCGYEWFPRTIWPKRCPNYECGSAKWNRKTEEADRKATLSHLTKSAEVGKKAGEDLRKQMEDER